MRIDRNSHTKLPFKAMKTVAVKELKNRLSVYLREVAQGEVLLVTDHGHVIAELRRPKAEGIFGAAEQALERLQTEGLLVPGLPHDAQAYRQTNVRLKSVVSQSLLDAERGER
jgi:antitoxin (DNA-binding transcriptional repressor) of toxin-antitoxin stability system